MLTYRLLSLCFSIPSHPLFLLPLFLCRGPTRVDTLLSCLPFKAIKKYPELACQVSQLGLDEQNGQLSGTKYSILRHEEGEAIALANDILCARHFLKKGSAYSQHDRA